MREPFFIDAPPISHIRDFLLRTVFLIMPILTHGIPLRYSADGFPTFFSDRKNENPSWYLRNVIMALLSLWKMGDVVEKKWGTLLKIITYIPHHNTAGIHYIARK
jgi:hypothetical protein